MFTYATALLVLVSSVASAYIIICHPTRCCLLAPKYIYNARKKQVQTVLFTTRSNRLPLRFMAASDHNQVDGFDNNTSGTVSSSINVEETLAHLMAVAKHQPSIIPDWTAFEQQIEKYVVGSKIPKLLATSKQSRNVDKLITDYHPKDDLTQPYDRLYLDPNKYLNSGDLLQKDGLHALSKGSMNMNRENRDAADGNIMEDWCEPTTVGMRRNSHDSWQEVWSELQRLQSMPFNATKAEELHQQVFEEEQCFLQQSKVLSQSMTDSKMTAAALMQQQGFKFRIRQAQAIQQLEQHLAEFEPKLMNLQRPEATLMCSKCGCKLQDEEFDIELQWWMKDLNLTQVCQRCYRALIQMSDNLEKPCPITTLEQQATATKWLNNSVGRRMTKWRIPVHPR